VQRGMEAGDHEESALHKQGRANGDMDTARNLQLHYVARREPRLDLRIGKFTSTLTSSSCSGLTFCPSSRTSELPVLLTEQASPIASGCAFVRCVCDVHARVSVRLNVCFGG
jgi:hypothetical protein